MEALIFLPALAILIALSGFFSGVEVALVSVSRLKVKELAKRGRRGSSSLEKLKKNPSRMLTTILVGNNIVNIAASAIATYIATGYFGSAGVGIATGAMTFLILVFGEITPKTYASTHNIRLALAVAPAILNLERIINPLVVLFESMTRLLTGIYGGPDKPLLTEKELKNIIEVGYEERILDDKDREIIEGAIEFDDIPVERIMTPIKKVKYLNEDTPVTDAVKYTNKTRFSRFPVDNSADGLSFIGVVHLKDLLRNSGRDNHVNVGKIMRRPYYTSSETRINHLLKQMQARKQHMAIVKNPWGDVVGVVTLENILEEIVGEIVDETDQQEKQSEG